MLISSCEKLTQVVYSGHLVELDMWSWSLPYFSHLLEHLPPRRTPLQGRQSELVPSVSILEGVDCNFM